MPPRSRRGVTVRVHAPIPYPAVPICTTLRIGRSRPRRHSRTTARGKERARILTNLRVQYEHSAFTVHYCKQGVAHTVRASKSPLGAHGSPRRQAQRRSSSPNRGLCLSYPSAALAANQHHRPREIRRCSFCRRRYCCPCCRHLCLRRRHCRLALRRAEDRMAEALEDNAMAAGVEGTAG